MDENWRHDARLEFLLRRRRAVVLEESNRQHMMIKAGTAGIVESRRWLLKRMSAVNKPDMEVA